MSTERPTNPLDAMEYAILHDYTGRPVSLICAEVASVLLAAARTEGEQRERQAWHRHMNEAADFGVIDRRTAAALKSDRPMAARASFPYLRPPGART